MSPSELKKRKSTSKTSLSRKRVKLTRSTADDLPWKAVARPAVTGQAADDGILELEEVDGVEIFYEDTPAGKVARFKIHESQALEKHDEDEEPESAAQTIVEDADVDVTFDSENLLPEWHKYPLHPKVMMALHAKDFSSPTPIQAAAIPIALTQRDVVGVAQTGSGKTLAYGLPILHYLLSKPQPSPSHKRPLRALILAPTRELALQVSSHLNSLLTPIEHGNNAKEGEGKKDATKVPPHVSVAAVVGGMSAQKQRRVLDRGVDVLVATPGRLWDILQDDDELAQGIKNLKFLVLDEADRMIEAGHFAELENILRLTLRESKFDETMDDADKLAEGDEDSKEGVKDGLQTFVFSATLSKDLQKNLKKGFKSKGNKKHYQRNQKPASTLDDLLLRLDFRDPEPEVIDLSPVGNVVSTLQEGKIECLSGDKDVYLYYFLLRHPGKSLVFLSAIDGIRRLMPLVELLDIKAFPLHSQLEQRQRLKNLDRFKNTPNSVLLATDIAARGLDITGVDHVIHFQIPRTADTYVHRNGRTARAMRKGFSMLMVAPDERRVVRALMSSLGREEDEVPELSIELSMLDKLKARVQLARKIEKAHHKVKKTNHDRNWMKETAEVLGVELDSDFGDSGAEDNQKKKASDRQTAAMKRELQQLLSQPLLARGISTRYITSGSRSIADDLLAGELNESMLGLKKADAGSDLIAAKKRKAKKTKNAAPVVEDTKTESVA